MGRLEDIVQRNRSPKGSRERFIWSIVVGCFLLLILALMVFTDLGRPANAPPPPPPDPAPSVPDHSSVPDVQLR